MWLGIARELPQGLTVPLVLAMGLGLGNAVSAVEGFGILSLASICPIIAVLTMGVAIRIMNKSQDSSTEDEIVSDDLVKD